MDNQKDEKLPPVTVISPGATSDADLASNESGFPAVAMTRLIKGGDDLVRIYVRADQVAAFKRDGWAKEA